MYHTTESTHNKITSKLGYEYPGQGRYLFEITDFSKYNPYMCLIKNNEFSFFLCAKKMFLFFWLAKYLAMLSDNMSQMFLYRLLVSWNSRCQIAKSNIKLSCLCKMCVKNIGLICIWNIWNIIRFIKNCR